MNEQVALTDEQRVERDERMSAEENYSNRAAVTFKSADTARTEARKHSRRAGKAQCEQVRTYHMMEQALAAGLPETAAKLKERHTELGDKMYRHIASYCRHMAEYEQHASEAKLLARMARNAAQDVYEIEHGLRKPTA